jgi:hypothetical protein
MSNVNTNAVPFVKVPDCGLNYEYYSSFDHKSGTVNNVCISSVGFFETEGNKKKLDEVCGLAKPILLKTKDNAYRCVYQPN